MRYRRNADIRLREMEREWSSTGNRDLLIPINLERRRAGLPPHPDARIIIANNALFEWTHRCASQLTTILQVYDNIDIPVYIDELPQDGIREEIVSLTNELQLLEQERRLLDRANIDIRLGDELDEEYISLLKQRNISLPTLGEAQEVEDEASTGSMFFHSKQMREQMTRSGFDARVEQWGWTLQLVCRRSLKIFRKLLLYGVIPMREILQEDYEDGTLAEDWFISDWHDLDELVDNIEIALNEIVDVTQGFGPSPEAVELFGSSWYRDN